MKCAKIDLRKFAKVKYFGLENFIPPKQHCKRVISENIIYFIISGELNLLHNNAPLHLKKGDIAFFYKGDAQEALFPSECEYFYIHYCLDSVEQFELSENEFYVNYNKTNSEFLKSNLHSLERYEFLNLVLPQVISLQNKNEFLYVLEKYKKFKSVFYEKNFESRVNLPFNFANLLLSFESAAYNNVNKKNVKFSKTFTTVSKIAKYIDENFKNEIGRKEIEENFNFSYDYANRIFKKEFGDGIVKYRNKVRIDNAKFLLTSTQKSVDEICEDVGFSDKYYFTRYFTKCVGMSPICYRNR